MAILSLALSKVENETLRQASDAAGSDGAMEETLHQGHLADALLRGEITQEVRELRWRMYKILNATENLTTKIVGYDEDNLPITETKKYGKVLLNKINVDDSDPYDVEMLINNDDIIKSTSEALTNEKIKLHSDEETVSNRSDRYDLVTGEKDIVETSDNSLGEISFEDMVSSMKSDKVIIVNRSLKPKFEIEQYAKKLVVREVDEDKKLIEFYLSKYSDEFDKKTVFLISEIKKIMKNPRSSNIIDIEQVGFITNKVIGVMNGMEYIYQIEEFYKVVEHDGHYVLKFFAKPLIEGKFIYDSYKLDDLEDKYKNKVAKKKGVK